MTGRHVAAPNFGWYKPGTWPQQPMAPAPRHSTETHLHDYKIVAVFEGLRESIAQCACGDTKTVFRTEADS